MKIKDRVKELRRVMASDLLPDPRNWRKHPKRQQDALRAVLAEIGFAGAALARETPDGLRLIDGHLRAETVPGQEIPVLVLDVSEAEAAKLLATLDPMASMAEQDNAALAALLGDLERDGDDLAALVWPDYVTNPLLAADWTPDKPSDDPPELGKPKGSDQAATGGEAPQDAGDVIRMTPEMRAVFDRAWASVKDALGNPAVSEGECLTYLCEVFLSEVAG